MRKYTIREAKTEIMDGMKAYLSKDEDGHYSYSPMERIPFYLEGPPGIGKTEIVRQIAEELGIGFVSFSVTHHTRNSLIGLPVIRDLEGGKKYTEYTMSEIIASTVRQQEKGVDEGILLLDEFNCASDTIMPTMLAFLQTRNIGLYRLPDNWIIVLCGNPRTFNSNAKTLTPAIVDRVRKLTIDPDGADFMLYAKERKLHPAVCSYLSANVDCLYQVNCSAENETVVTCRGWENLSHTIDVYEKQGIIISRSLVHQYIKSEMIAESFWNHYILCRHGLDMKTAINIIEGEDTEKYKELFDQKDEVFRQNALSFIERTLIRDISFDSNKDISKKISNILKFLGELKDAVNMTDIFFYNISREQSIITALTDVRNKDYIALARRNYARDKAV